LLDPYFPEFSAKSFGTIWFLAFFVQSFFSYTELTLIYFATIFVGVWQPLQVAFAW